jgi:TolB-like protein/Flp pilus assembly protein TadD
LAAATLPAVADTGLRSIAVLPFADLSKEQDQGYMSDGLAEELLNLLAKVPRLRVIARTSSFSFKGKDADIATIGKALGVDHVLQGSVRKAGKRLRISAQLVRADDNTQVWSETYDRDAGDVFAVQDEIAAAVVVQLKVKLMGEVPHAQKTDPRAYALFLRGRQSGRRGDATGLVEAAELYKQALAIDPAYAPAWVGLSGSYANQANSGQMGTEEGFRLAREAVGKALAIDPDSARAHAQAGFIALSHDGDYVTAARHLERALAIAPDDLSSILNASRLAQSLGRLDQAIALDQYVTAHDPVNARAHYNLGVDYYFAGRRDDAIASWRTTLALSPGYIGAWYNIAMAQMHAGQAEAALESMRREPPGIWQMIGMPMVYHALGKDDEADAALAALVKEHARDSAYNIAYVYALRGDPDQAFTWLDRAVANSDPGLSDLALEPDFNSLHKDPRWLPLLEKLGKAPAQLAAIKFQPALPE